MMRTRQSREMKTLVNKTWIIDKAGALFWQKGYEGTSMRDIAKACGCQPANIYNYFTSKEEILYEVIKNNTEQTVASVEHLENDETTDPVEQLRSFIKGHFEMLARMKRTNVLISDAGLKDLTAEHRKAVIQLRDKYDIIIRRVIRRGIDTGQFVVKDERVVGYFISSVIIRSSIWFSPKGALSADEIGDEMFDFVYKGIKAETK
jgi:AcrR family transcriptional regulator